MISSYPHFIAAEEKVIILTVNWMQFALIAVLLMIFSVLYNYLVEKLGDLQEGYTSLLVVGGVGVTLFGSAFIIGWAQAALVALLFVVSGTPMIMGEIFRAVRNRKALREDCDGKR
jgi:cation transport ATPase